MIVWLFVSAKPGLFEEAMNLLISRTIVSTELTFLIFCHLATRLLVCICKHQAICLDLKSILCKILAIVGVITLDRVFFRNSN